MKKMILMLAAAGLSLSATAQKSNIRVANNALSAKEYDKAKEAIDAAVANAETSADGRAWYVRGEVYLSMQEAEQYKASNPYREAYKSYQKAIELNHKSEDLNNRLLAVAFYFYNDGIRAYNAKQFDQAYELFKNAADIRDIEGGKRFAGDKTFDTTAANARFQAASSAYYAKNYQMAVPLLESAKANPITKQEYIYEILADSYDQLKNDAKFIETLTEGRKLYPGNQYLKNAELNYYIKSNKQDELVKKLEEAVAQEPGNGDLSFNLGNTYMTMAFNKVDGKLPSNFNDLFSKAENAFTNALKAKPENADYNYNMGALYFNYAAEVNAQINALGTSAADMKKYDGLKAQKEGLFKKALPYLEKTYNTLSPKGSYTPEEASTYRSSLIALQNIYASLNMKEKYEEIKKKMAATK